MALGKLLSPGARTPRRLLGKPEAQELAVARLPWIMWPVFVWAFAIVLRLIWLQVFEHHRYQSRASQQHNVEVPIPPIRGELRDRRGASLAISMRLESLFCNPPAFYPDYKSGRGQERVWGEPNREAAQVVANKLAPILEIPAKTVLEKLLRKKPFVWIERHMGPAKASTIKALKLEGVEFLPEFKRQYPRGSLACQILGFTNIDGIGQLGIERTFNEQLAGKPGELVAPRDAKGRLLILQENYSKIPVNGSTLQLTIDSTIQHIVEEALEEGVRLSRPKNAYAVVMDPNTGEILAMAGTPFFDPNHIIPKKFMNRSESEWSAGEREEYRAEIERGKEARKVHPVEDSYEPGSTMKVFTLAMALEERKVHLGEKVNCEGGRWNFGGGLTVTDTHGHGLLTFEEVLWQSSNIGAAKIGVRMDPATHYQYLRKFGFGDLTGLNFPGETAGRLLSPDRWSGTTQPTMSYGYGLSVSPLQVLVAGCAVANGGKLMQPYLVQKIFNDQGVMLQENRPKVRNQVISEETSAMMREALKGVITNGTAKNAKLDGGVEAFGKTGTAWKVINGKYVRGHHYASFMGFFPADKPQYGMLFMLDDPAGGAYGGTVAAPLFKKIGDGIMRYRTLGSDSEQNPDLKLSLRDWPVSETDEAVVHVEVGKVPDVRNLALKSAIQRIVMAGGSPRVEGTGAAQSRAFVVAEQSPEPGTALEPGKPVRLVLRGP
ncbi:penicillin-binding transpeptidase domain-containing protein [Holophaga foetida]|uniref:penicillin-binding transpeptidase domain-containing protein n=1 Tax=Holophaga foetida TaxID=35839 RepID=UPI0002474A1E|nr:penicillin-binding transpeptidase domain-containing protein [Holophaga foetida]